MRASKKILSMAVLSLENGEQIGKVKGLIIDPGTLNIAALVLEQKGGWFKEARVITFEHVQSVGEHAITVAKTRCIEKASSLPHIMQLVRNNLEVIGAKVVSQDGNLLGTVEEYLFDPASGRLTSLEISGRLLDSLFKGKAYLPTEMIITLGKHAIIVDNSTQEKIIRQESGLQETVKSVKDAGSKVWSSTVETTKRLGESISKTVEKFTQDDDDYEIKPPQEPRSLSGEAEDRSDSMQLSAPDGHEKNEAK